MVIICGLAFCLSFLVVFLVDPTLKMAILLNRVDGRLIYHDVGVLRTEGKNVRSGIDWTHWFAANLDMPPEEKIHFDGTEEPITWVSVDCDGLEGLCGQLKTGGIEGKSMVIHHVEMVQMQSDHFLLNKASIVENGKIKVNYQNHYRQSPDANDTVADYSHKQRLRWLIQSMCLFVVMIMIIYDNRKGIAK